MFQTTTIALENLKFEEKEELSDTDRRIVQVFIADPDENVPIDRCLLYSGDQHLTDSTDEELFYDVEIKQMLADYNVFRVTVVDKGQSAQYGREVFLDPAKIRDLKMTVAVAASF